MQLNKSVSLNIPIILMCIIREKQKISSMILLMITSCA